MYKGTEHERDERRKKWGKTHGWVILLQRARCPSSLLHRRHCYLSAALHRRRCGGNLSGESSTVFGHLLLQLCTVQWLLKGES